MDNMIEIAREQTEIKRRYSGVVNGYDAITLRASSTGRSNSCGGAPMKDEGYIRWNFVSSRPERIEDANEEWARGRLDSLPGEEADWITLSEDQEKPRCATGRVLYPQTNRKIILSRKALS